MTKRQHASDDEFDPFMSYSLLDDDLEEEPGFKRIRRSGDKPASPKSDRRQQDKEWGKQINKFHKQRKKITRNQKP